MKYYNIFEDGEEIGQYETVAEVIKAIQEDIDREEAKDFNLSLSDYEIEVIEIVNGEDFVKNNSLLSSPSLI